MAALLLVAAADGQKSADADVMFHGGAKTRLTVKLVILGDIL